ncbi:hypothetical protein CDL15_Pgr000910 [Punica granatum]|uniref:DUF1005 domain-containing protein n=1 Tax=Punica granatum TaxID=22663 RepID=A0A218XI70_PUNGR|nr:hypothetical protein CDL15_Pgr000910 [Punica granatum]
MDPCPFVRLIVESLSLKLPPAAKPVATAGIHPATTPCFCKITLNHFPSQTALLPLADTAPAPSSASTPAAVFHLDPAALRRLSGRPATLRVSIYAGRSGHTCGVRSGKLLGRVKLGISLKGAGSARPGVLHCGWTKLGKHREADDAAACAKLHLVVRSEPEPRFVFQFGGEPECSPVVFQIQGNIRQPVFSCKFNADRNSRSRTLSSDFTSHRPWSMGSFLGDRERQWRERKGWMIMIYDLSGSLVAAASIITPFVPSPGSDRVSRSNPGAWLILRAHGHSLSSWKPWGRLEAWRERGLVDGLGYKFELVTENGPACGIPISEGTMNMKKGGNFCIDSSHRAMMRDNPGICPWPPIRGFVMSSSVEGGGKASKPVVQVGAQHVKCMSDVALFIALSAAIDLSMDACQLFSRKLRKELCHEEQGSTS